MVLCPLYGELDEVEPVDEVPNWCLECVSAVAEADELVEWTMVPLVPMMLV